MKRIIIAMTLILALVLSVGALAEVTEPEAPAAQSELAAPEEADEAADDAVTLEDAFKALFEARLSTKLEELQAELDEYVAAGKLTQEQADLIMNSIKERQEAMQGNGGYDWRQMPGNRQQFPGMQGGDRQFGQCPGMQGGNRQFGQFPGMQGGNRQFGQCPGMQDGNQIPQMPGNQQGGNGQCPGMRDGDRQFGQCPGMQGGNQMPQMPGSQRGGNDPFGQFPGQR